MKEKEIDYLHPHGKPHEEQNTQQKKVSIEQELFHSLRNYNRALQEADGHHRCSAECQKHHKVSSAIYEEKLVQNT